MLGCDLIETNGGTIVRGPLSRGSDYCRYWAAGMIGRTITHTHTQKDMNIFEETVWRARWL